MGRAVVPMILASFLGLVLSVAPAAAKKHHKDDGERSRAALSVSAREGKMLLLPTFFEDPSEGMERFWALAREVAAGLDVDAEDADDAEDEWRFVRFIDTPGFDGYRRDYILRRRDGATAGQSEPREGARAAFFDLTLKARSADLAEVQAAQVAPEEGSDAKDDLEEDAVVGEAFVKTLYARAGKAYFDDTPEATVGAYRRIFPGLSALGLSDGAALATVNGVIIKELSRDVGTLDFGKRKTANASFAIWYRAGEAKPLIAEFSFKYKIKDDDSPGDVTAAAKLSNRFLLALQAAGREWYAAGLTKTGLVYQTTGGRKPPAPRAR